MVEAVLGTVPRDEFGGFSEGRGRVPPPTADRRGQPAPTWNTSYMSCWIACGWPPSRSEMKHSAAYVRYASKATSNVPLPAGPNTADDANVQVVETAAVASEPHASTQPFEAVQTNEVVSVIERWRTKVVAVNTPRVRSRAVPRHGLVPYLQEAVDRVEHGPAERSVAQSTSTDSSDRDRDEVARYKNENAALKTQVRKLLTVLEPHLEKIWEIDRNAFFELREEINTLRRI